MAEKQGQELGNLPNWDLSDLYPGRDSDVLNADLARIAKDAASFRDTYRGKLLALDGARFGKAIAEYEAMQEVTGRILSYSQLEYSGNVSDPATGKFAQTMRERVTEISTDLIFFTLEINELDDAVLNEKLAAPECAKYEPWLRDVRVYRPHQLAEDMEKLLHEKYVSGRAAWNRLFDETMASLRFPFDGKTLTTEETLHFLADHDAAVRQKAAKTLGTVLRENARIFCLVTNTLAKDKEVDDKWRHYPRPPSARNLGNQVEDEVVDALVAAVKNAYPRLSHAYYQMKAEWFGKDQLDYWDRNAPLPDSEDRLVGWDEAKGIVLDAYGKFSPELASIGKRFFDNAWIDAPAREGKAGGAFAHPTVPSAHPYLMLNYMGRTRDVMTLAHELGHGVHQVLAGPQGALMAGTPLTLAETASVFGEMLTFRALLARETDPKRRRSMLASKVEDMLNTVVRQIAFYDFELRVHTERRKGELTEERLCDIWMEVQRESLGPALRFDDDYRYYWTYIPHFIHSPFYVYAYAFGDCLVNSLYAVYENADEGFAGRYLDMLRAGGTKRHKELLAPFGLDASDPAFWDKGLGVVSGLIEELRELSKGA